MYAAPPSSVSTPAYVNPSQMQATQLATDIPKKKPPQNSKRKRANTPDDTDSQSQPRKLRDGPKKKKANRACFHCQKAHLTCDDSRPCQRCIKRGIASNCTEGHRKKAKYLLDEEELEQLKRSKSAAPEATTESASLPPSEPLSNPDPMLHGSYDPNFSFGSEAANLEYSILSAILGNPSPPESTTSPPRPPSSSQYTSWHSADPMDFVQSPRLAAAPSTSNPPPNQGPTQILEQNLPLTNSSAQYLTYAYTQPNRQDDTSELQYPPHQASQSQGGTVHPLQPRFPLDARPRSPPATVFLQPEVARTLLSPVPSASSPISSSSALSGPDPIPRPRSSGSQLQGINDRVTAPYDYTQGYHFLMKHLPTRFEKNDILRIVRALAIFRPSLIALQMPLSLDDEIFVEKCFQRSILELDKLISFSGTPTVVWRRTGEICLVAPEFCMLTEWSMEELIGHKKYIYELFENQSVVEYWENFANHAFENITQSVYSHCVLLKPSGAPVPSTFCFSIRRDLFDLPSIVIGQWLPLL